MSVYYPAAAVILEILWEDFDGASTILNKEHPLVVQPKSITVKINSHVEADTCRFLLDYKSFPFEPRTIRSMRVTVAMANLKGLFDGAGNENRLFPNDITKMSPAQRTQFNKQLEEQTVFAGFADESEITFNDSSREVVVECRDQTALLIDRKQPRNVLDLNRSLFDLVREILDQSDSTKPLQIEFRPTELKDAVPSIAAASGEITENKKSIKAGETAWDVINDLCKRVALVPFIDIDRLVITRPRLLFSDSSKYVLTWGDNITGLSFKRKLGRDKGINIEVRALDLGGKVTKRVRYPEDRLGGPEFRQKIVKIVEGERKEEDAPFHVFFYPPGNWVESVLLDRAEDIWQEMARQEIEGRLTTKEMILCEKETNKPKKTLDLKMGTAIQINISPRDAEALDTLRKSGQGIGEMVKFLQARCYRKDIATALAHAYELNRKFTSPFYTKSVQLNIDAQGFKADLEFINFIQLDPKVTGVPLDKAGSNPNTSIIYQFLKGSNQEP